MRWSRTILVSQILACGSQLPDSVGIVSTMPTTGAESSGTPTSGPGSTDTTGQTATSEATTNDSVGFFPPDPDTSVEPECDPHAEMSCPEGQKCSVSDEYDNHWSVYAGVPGCFPILGDLPKGAPCDPGRDPDDGLDDCAANMVCIDWDGGPVGICREFCNPILNSEAGTCSDPTEFCYSAGCQSCSLAICIPACDPLLADCPDGQGCIQGYNHNYKGFSCAEIVVDLPAVGQPCDDTYECAAGASCVFSKNIASPTCADADVCCTPLCDLEAANTCPGKAEGETCHPYFTKPFDPQAQPWGVQYNRLGLCLLGS